MILDLVSKKCSSGEVAVNLARIYLDRHEWGLARRSLLDALEKGGVGDLKLARTLLSEIDLRMGVGSITQTGTP